MRKVKLFLLTMLAGTLLAGCSARKISVQTPVPNNRVDSGDSQYIDGEENANNESTPSQEGTTPSTEEGAPSAEGATPSTEDTSPSTEKVTPPVEEEITAVPEKQELEVIIGTMEPYYDNEKGELALLDPYTQGTVVLQFDPDRYVVIYAGDTYASVLDLKTYRVHSLRTVMDEIYPECHAYRYWQEAYEASGDDVKEENRELKIIAGCDMQTYQYHVYSESSVLAGMQIAGVDSRYIGYYTTLPDGTTLMTSLLYYEEGEDIEERENSLFQSVTLYSTGEEKSQTPDTEVTSIVCHDENGEGLCVGYVYPEGLSISNAFYSPSRYSVPDVVEGYPVVRYVGGNFWKYAILGNIREIRNVEMTGSTLETFGPDVSLKGVKRITLKPEQYCSSIIPEGIEYIAYGERSASKGCYLREMTFPSSLKKIEGHAFSYFSKLEKVTFLEGEQQLVIGSYAFKGTKISEVVLPDNVVSVGERAFETNGEWTTLCLSKNLKYIGAFAFYNTYSSPDTQVFVVPEGCIYVGDGAFKGGKVVIPDSVQYVGAYMNIITTAGSPAEAFAKEHGYSYEIISEEEMAQYQSRYAD